MKIGKKELDMEAHPYVMGILNVTPDSFSDGGRHSRLDDALFAAERMICAGADIVDVGGESTRPGYQMISEAEEIERTAPVIERLRAGFDSLISIDTYKSEVAEAGLSAGADLVNDIWGLTWDERMAAVVKKHEASCCLTHNRKNALYDDFLSDVEADVNRSIQIALDAGIGRDRLMIDPGIGFAKTTEQNLLLMNHLERLQRWGLPVLLGASRKSVIGRTLDLPVDKREEGTIATSVIGLMKGCRIFRVHDVEKNVRALRMAWAIMQSGK